MTTSEPHEPGDRFAAGRSFPTTLPAPGTGAELGGPVKLYSTETRPWPVPAAAPGRGAAGGRLRAGGSGGLAAPWPPRRPHRVMAGEGGTVNDLSAADVAGRLRVLLGAIEANLDHTAYLRGAADALMMVADQR